MNYHIFNSASAMGTFKMFLKENNLGKDNETLFFDDDFLAFGPIFHNFFDKNFLQKRNDWIFEKFFTQKYYNFYFEKNEINNIYADFSQNISRITHADVIWIYVNNDANGIIFLSFLLNYFENYDIRVKICQKDGYRMTLGEYNAQELGEKFFKKGRRLNMRQRDFYKNICKNTSENNNLRIWKQRQIVELDENYFDEKILKIIPRKQTALLKIVGKILGNKEKILEIRNDVFIVWRLCELNTMKKIAIYTEKCDSCENIVGKTKIGEKFLVKKLV